jgi:hypothetical protein
MGILNPRDSPSGIPQPVKYILEAEGRSWRRSMGLITLALLLESQAELRLRMRASGRLLLDGPIRALGPEFLLRGLEQEEET